MSTFRPEVAVGNHDLAQLLKGMRNDIVALEASIEAITAKLDGDSGVNLTNYASTCNPTIETN